MSKDTLHPRCEKKQKLYKMKLSVILDEEERAVYRGEY